jgi:S-DNA-T family DNA segregation ATPase FtsK/SpoIIIE
VNLQDLDPRRQDFLVEASLLLALAGEALLLVALLTYGPDPHEQQHMVGMVGRFLASLFYGGFGVAAFLLVALALYTTLLRMVRRTVTAPLMRVVGGLLVLVGACTFVHQFFPDLLPDRGAGGLLGEITFDLMRVPFGAFGTFIFSVVFLCTGFAFATDWLVYEMLYDGVRRLTSAAGLLRRFWPQTALAGAEGAEAVAEPVEAPAPKGRGKKKEADADAAPQDAEAAVEPEAEPPPTEDESAADASAEEPGELELIDPDVEVPPDMLEGLPRPEEAPAKPVLEVKLDRQAEKPKPAVIERPRAAGDYEFPSHQLLDRPKPRNLKELEKAIQHHADVLHRTLQEFRVEGEVVDFQQGPVVTMLEVALAPGTKVTKIHALADDLAMALKAESVRIVAPIPGKSTVGIEIPNPVRADVRLLSLLESEEYRRSDYAIPLLLGVGADGRSVVTDMAKMPHLLIAGATGSGKSVCVNTILLSILLTRTPDDVRLILVDPKQVELAFFADVPHLMTKVVTDMRRAASVLEWAVQQMEERYDVLRRYEVRNIASYNQLGERAIAKRTKELGIEDETVPVKLPYIVIIVDELADLMLTVGKDIEHVITRLAQKSRAVGIHIVLATQRPSTDVITGLIKANMPTRIAFKVTSKVDSRVVMDQNGAEKLLGMGDMLYLPPQSSAVGRAQGTFAADREVKRIVRFLKERYPQEFDEKLSRISAGAQLSDEEKDELYDQAVRIVLEEQRGSASLLQRALAIGYTRASRLLDQMRKEGVVGSYRGSKASEVLLTLEDYEARHEG